MLVVFAAQRYASQLVLPASKRRPSVLPSSHRDIARKAFERVTKNVLAASHVQLVRALAARHGPTPRASNLTNRQREAILAVATPQETPADEDPRDDVEVGDLAEDPEVGEVGD